MSNTPEFLKARAKAAEDATQKAQHRFVRERLDKENVIAEKKKVEDTMQEYLRRFMDATEKIHQLEQKVFRVITSYYHNLTTLPTMRYIPTAHVAFVRKQ